MNIRHIHSCLGAQHHRSTIAAALFFLLTAIPLHSQDAPAAVPAVAPERETIDFEGIRIVFPKGEADVVEQLKPALRKFREERKRAVEAEAKDIAECLSGAEKREALRKAVAFFTAREAVSDQFDARWALQAVTMQKLADAWTQWSGDISELQLWERDELAAFQTRPDGGDDEKGVSHQFPQTSIGKNRSEIAVKPPFLMPLIGLDILKLTKDTKPLRLDIPLLYKAGESPEQIATFSRALLDLLPGSLQELLRGLALPDALARWAIENMLLGEVEAVFIERRTAAETALADGLTRFLLLATILKQDGEGELRTKLPRLFPFGMNGWDLSNPAAILLILEKLDPLANVEQTKTTGRIFARNLIALTLLDVAQKGDGRSPILHKFKKAGVAVPDGGFTMDSFIAAVDTAYGEQGFFQRALAARKAKTLEQVRASFGKLQEKETASPPPAVKPPAAAAEMPGRLKAKFDGLTITFPAELKAAVEIVGPEYAKVFAKAREAMEALCKKKPPAAIEVTDADSAALRAYGVEPDARVLHQFAVFLGALHDGTQLARWFTSGDRMQVWIKEDMLAFLKGGGTVEDFSLAPDGEHVSWKFGFRVSDKFPEAGKPMPSDSDALAEAVRRLDAVPRPVYPIVLKPGELPEKLDDPAAVAAAIRKAEGILELLRMAAQNPETTAKKIASIIPKFGQEHGWFIVAHEVAEFAIMESAIRSADRRWFCDGMANWIAIRDVDRRYGAGKGTEAFAKLYDAADLRKHAAKVDLLAWPTGEDVDNGSRPDVENPDAHYYFATLVIEKACEGRDAGFVKSWLDEIRKTPQNRANSGTVLAAYRKLTGGDLKAVIAEVVK